jgi:uncharacterized protein YaiE (UPF0345 family)
MKKRKSKRNNHIIARKSNNKNRIIILINASIILIFLVIFLYSSYNAVTSWVVYNLGESGNIPNENNLININYEKGLSKEISFSITNEEHKNMKVLLMIEGDLNDSVFLNENIIDFLPSDDYKKVNYRIKLDKDLESGLHTVKINGLIVPSLGPGEDYSSSDSKIYSEIRVYVPYKNKYIDGEISNINAEQNKTTQISIDLYNRGNMTIDNVKAVFYIYTLLDEKIISIESETKTISVGKNIKLSANWKTDVFPGDYIVRANIYYDGNNKTFEKKFSVGAKNLSIDGILVNNFQLGEIAKLQILVDNKWNQELKGVYANLIVYDNDNQIMAQVKSSADDIPALTKKELIAYWDTVGVKEGEYKGKLSVNYQEKSTDKNLILKVSKDNLDITGVGYTIRPNGGTTNITSLLLIFIILLLIVNLAWFVFFKRMIKKNNKKI